MVGVTDHKQNVVLGGKEIILRGIRSVGTETNNTAWY